MTAAEGTFLGLAKQTAEGTPNVTDASFEYLLFQRGSVSPNNIYLPLGAEVGGGALERAMVKAGVNLTGAIQVIPRPATLGHFLYGATGAVATVGTGPSYTHTFKLAADQFAAPFYTVRSAPGDLWGEQFADCRVNALSLEFRAADFVRGRYGILGKEPSIVSTAAWNALSQVDGGPQFLAPLGSIELPTGTSAKVLNGAFVAASVIPLDQQYIVGSYFPEGLDIVHRTFVLSLTIKVDDGTLYKKMMYDPAAGSSWLASIFKEADFTLSFNSDVEADTGVPYSIRVAANGQSGANANVYWTAEALDIIAQRQLVMNVTGMYVADPLAGDPIVITLVNTKASY